MIVCPYEKCGTRHRITEIRPGQSKLIIRHIAGHNNEGEVVRSECGRTSTRHSGYRRYLYHQGKEQTTGGTVEAAAKPWLIPAGKYFAAHRPQGQHPP